MQTQLSFAKLAFTLYAVLRTHIARLVVAGVMLVLIIAVAVLALHLTGQAHIVSAASQLVSGGPPDVPTAIVPLP